MGSRTTGTPLAPRYASSSTPDSGIVLPRRRPRRSMVVAACLECRKRKSKCSAERPRCSLCVIRDTECVYTTEVAETHTQALKRKFNDLTNVEQSTSSTELINFIRTRSAAEAIDVLRHLRAGSDIKTILDQVKSGDALLQLSLAPPVQRQYRFPYVAEMPSYLMTKENEYLKARIYEASFSTLFPTDITALSQAPISTEHPPSYQLPYFAANLVDPLVSKVTVSKWTLVTSDDQLLRRLLDAYLLYFHPSFIILHKDYFLKDMADGRERFCSPLLVNAVLAVACYSCYLIKDRAKFWIPQNLAYQFNAEAKRLWELETRKKGKLTTIQAALILHIASNLNSLDVVGMGYLESALDLAHGLDLFQNDSNIKSKSVQRVREITAWGIFTWQAMLSYYHRQAPLLRHPPVTPIPDASQDPLWFGEIWIQYPQSESLIPLHFSHVFKARAALRIIMNDVAAYLFDNSGIKTKPSFDDIQRFKSRLDHHIDNLPEVLQTRNMALPIHMHFHIEYYGLIIALLQPIVATGPTPTELPPDCTSLALQNTIHQARLCLETVIRLYYLRHGFEMFDPYLPHFLTLLANLSLKELYHFTDTHGKSTIQTAQGTEKSLLSTVILSVQGLADQASCYHLANLLFHALTEQVLRHSDLDLVMAYTSSPPVLDDASRFMTKYSHYPMPGMDITEDPRDVRLNRLLRKPRGAFSDISDEVEIVSESE